MNAKHVSDAVGLRATVLRYLESHRVVTLATSEPWAAAVFYANEGFTLYYLSAPGSRHAEHFARDPRAAATIEEQYDDWRAIKGVQLEGTVREVEPERLAGVRALYAAKFPVIAGRSPANARVLEALARIRWYALVPARVCFIDNSRGFGHRDEIELA